MAGSGGLANVAGAVLCGESLDCEQAIQIAELLGIVCEEVLLVGSPPSQAVGRRVSASGSTPLTLLSLLVAALEASSAPRVLVVDASSPAPGAALLLALTAWPEGEAVLLGTQTEAPACAIYQREAVLDRARRRLAAGDGDLSGLLAAGEVALIAGRDLEAITGAL